MKRTFLLLSMAAVIAFTSLTASAEEKKPEKKPDFDKIFKRLDADKNGELTEKEFVGKKEAKKAEQAKKLFKRLDKDKNGTVSLKEFKERPKKKSDK